MFFICTVLRLYCLLTVTLVQLHSLHCTYTSVFVSYNHKLSYPQVQIRPWCLSDSLCIREPSENLDLRKAVFVGGVPRPLKAVELAQIMRDKYGSVVLVAIDCDADLKYPKGTHNYCVDLLNLLCLLPPHSSVGMGFCIIVHNWLPFMECVFSPRCCLCCFLLSCQLHSSSVRPVRATQLCQHGQEGEPLITCTITYCFGNHILHLYGM